MFKVFPDDNLVVIVFCSKEAATAGTRAGLSIGDGVDSCSSKQFRTGIRVMVMQYDDDDRPAKDWILRTDYGLDGDSLSYEDRLGGDDDISQL